MAGPYFWVGGTGTWDNASNTHWAASSGGAGGAGVPVSSDNVTIDANSGTGAITIAATAACNNCTAAWTTSNTNNFSLSGNFAPSGTLSLTGSSASPLLVQSNTLGTPRTITAAAVSLSNVDFMDIVGAGAATWSGTSLGDALGNSGITFTPAATQYWKTATTGSKTWSTAANWFLGSNGTGGAGRVPLPQDNVVFDANSIGATGTTVTADMPRIGASVNWTGVTNTPAYLVSSGGVGAANFGSLTFAAGMTVNPGAFYTQLCGRGSHTLTTAGATLYGLAVNAPGGTYTLQDAYAGTFYTGVNAGTLSTNFNVTVPKFYLQSGVGTLNMGSGTWTLTGIAGADYSWYGAAGSGTFTINAQTSTIKLTDASSGAKTFQGGNKTYNNVWFAGGGSGVFNITGSNTFNDLRIDRPANVQPVAGSTQTVTTLTVPAYIGDAKYGVLNGVSGNYFSTPDSVASSVTGDIDIRVKMSMSSWSPATSMGVVGKYSASSNSYMVFIRAGGAIQWYASADGTTNSDNGLFSTAVAPFTAGATGYIRVTKAAATGVIKFYTSTDGIAWTQLGTDVAGGVFNIFDGLAPVIVGALSPPSYILAGNVYRAQIYNGIAGTLVVDFNPNDFTSGNTWVSNMTGEVWTRNGQALIYPEVMVTSQTAAAHSLVAAPGLNNYVVAGAELVTSGTALTTTTGWTAAFQSSLAAVGGNLVATAVGGNNPYATQQITVTPGAYYLVTASALGHSGAGQELLFLGSTVGLAVSDLIKTDPLSGSSPRVVKATTSLFNLQLIGGLGAVGDTYTWGAISIRPVVAGAINCDFMNLSYSQASGATFFAGGLNHSTNGGNNTGWTFNYGPWAVAAGAFVEAGVATSLLKASKLVAAAGAFSLSGKAASLLKASRLSAAAGAFTVAGTSTNLLARRWLSTAAGAFSVAGTATTLRASRILSAARGVFTLVGKAIGLYHTSNGPATRVMVVPAESRVMVVPAESRVMTVPADPH